MAMVVIIVVVMTTVSTIAIVVVVVVIVTTMAIMITVTMVTTVTPSELSFGTVRPREPNATLNLGYGRCCKGTGHGTKGGGQQQGRADSHGETCLNERK